MPQDVLSAPPTLPVHLLQEHPANVRRHLGDIDTLTESIRQLGVLQPLAVRWDGDSSSWRVLAGKRRLAAAAAVGLTDVPVFSPDLGDNPDVLAVLVENIHRKDLTVAEEADAYAQLELLLGLDAAGIATRTGVDEARVGKALRVAGSATAEAVARKHAELTLEQAVTIAEFEADREVVKELTVAAVKDPGQFDHLAEKHRREAARLEVFRVAHDELVADGQTVLPDGTSLEYYVVGRSPMPVDRLAGPGGKAFTAAKHRSCEGHAFVVKVGWLYGDDPGWHASSTAVCANPKKYKHTSTWSGSSGSTARPKMSDLSPDEQEKARAARRELIENNEAWRAATTVRRTWVAELLKRKTPPKGTLRYALGEVLGCPGDMNRHHARERSIELFGAGDDDLVVTPGQYQSWPGWNRLQDAPDPAMPLVLLGHVAGVVEAAMSEQTWQVPFEQAIRWFVFLEGAGYTLAPIERRVLLHVPLARRTGKA